MPDEPEPTYIFRGTFGDEVIEVEMTAEQVFDTMHRRQPIVTIGDGEPIIDPDGRLGARHRNAAPSVNEDPDDEDLDDLR